MPVGKEGRGRKRDRRSPQRDRDAGDGRGRSPSPHRVLRRRRDRATPPSSPSTADRRRDRERRRRRTRSANRRRNGGDGHRRRHPRHGHKSDNSDDDDDDDDARGHRRHDRERRTHHHHGGRRRDRGPYRRHHSSRSGNRERPREREREREREWERERERKRERERETPRQRSPSPSEPFRSPSCHSDVPPGRRRSSHRPRGRSRRGSRRRSGGDDASHHHGTARGEREGHGSGGVPPRVYHRHPSGDGTAGEGRAVRHAGVVSDDEDGCHPHARDAPARDGAAPGTHHAAASKHHHKKHDDTTGHFEGRDGCVVADRYRILREVGVGTFGRVVECLDTKRRRGTRRGRGDGDRGCRPRQHCGGGYSCNSDRDRDESPGTIVAIKIVRNIQRYYDSAKIEADIVEDVNRKGKRGVTHCAVLYDTFSFRGHYCMVFESLGPSLYDFLKGQNYHPFPIHCVFDFARQLLETLEFLHSFRLIHTDLKPENILLVDGRTISQRGGHNIPQSTRIKVIDFGGATYDDEKKGSIVNTRQYRAPEVILGVGWSMPSDLWSIGCILAELYQGELLFATHDNTEHLALIEKVVGPFPRAMLKKATQREVVGEAFGANGAHKMERVLPADQLSYVNKTPPLESIVATHYEEDAWLPRLLRRILVIDPNERSTARECLRDFRI